MEQAALMLSLTVTSAHLMLVWLRGKSPGAEGGAGGDGGD
eukprot:CAMPEP_0181252048 /NCGR_PEP_ID=MMETSP1096-20121128/47247_1 /TAXON_ID=156174 ORGANISM="Chrysochromulina ericina, Strain CCMP281" /NCGR_SAMPLE_ID=MMETSP1096 /ASSEMBLY_ACC=CAM_ASM_000453 /LENGTH=39 /DNA_ID= /DNA_START= /DNA_END= /DNA_ORIENTATION=